MVADQSDWPWRLNGRFACTRSLEMNAARVPRIFRELADRIDINYVTLARVLAGRRFLGFLRRSLNFGQAGQAM